MTAACLLLLAVCLWLWTAGRWEKLLSQHDWVADGMFSGFTILSV